MHKLLISFLAAMFLLSSCADMNPASVVSSRPKLVESISREDVSLLSEEHRVELLRIQSAAVNRDDARIWTEVARIYFKNESYGKAIFYAEESLKRDPGNIEATSLIAVCGLRVAAAAVDSLRHGHLQKAGVPADERAVTEFLRSAIDNSSLVPRDYQKNQ